MALLQATPQNITMAAHAIRKGELVAIPTETVYGLGGDATNGAAVVKIFTAKDRPRFNPLIVHVASTAAVAEFAELTPVAVLLAKAFWPGPLTLILPLQQKTPIADITVAGLQTVAVRIPSHPVAHQLIKAAGCPIAAPSANISGYISATTAEHVATDFKEKVAIILDAGQTTHGLESTIIDATQQVPTILRHGSVTKEQIKALTGRVDEAASQKIISPIAPGQLKSHYAPKCAVRLEATQAMQGEALLAFGVNVPRHDGPTINLSPTSNLVEAATNLFTAMRDLDASNPRSIAVMPIPNHGIGAAINDRLKRAAAPRK